MGSLQKFLGQIKVIEIDGVPITLHPLKVEHMGLFENKKELTKEESFELSKKIIKLSIPDATDEEIDGIKPVPFGKIMEEIYKLNGFVDEDFDKIRLARKLKQQNEIKEKSQ